MFAHCMMGDLWAYLPTPCWAFSSFDQKQHAPHALPSLFTRACPKWLFLCFPRWKTSQREMFCRCGRGETKNSRSSKRHQKWMSPKTVLSSGKNILIGVSPQMEGTLKVTEVYTRTSECTVFYEYIPVWGGVLARMLIPPCLYPFIHLPIHPLTHSSMYPFIHAFHTFPILLWCCYKCGRKIIPSRHMPRSGIAGPYSSSLFNNYSELHDVFHEKYPCGHPYQQCIRVPFSPSFCGHLLFHLFFF